MTSAPHILVVDDDPILRAVASEILGQAGYRVAEAEDGVEALRYLETAAVDLAVIDMLMPNKDGVETIMAMRQSWPDIRILGISGGARSLGPDQLLTMASLLGAHAVMTKPLRSEAFLASVREALDGSDAAKVA